MAYTRKTSDGSVVTTTNYLLEDLEGMQILSKVAAEVTRQSKENCPDDCCHGDTDTCLREGPHSDLKIHRNQGSEMQSVIADLPKSTNRTPPKRGEIKPLTGGDTVVARRPTLPPRPSMKPYPKEGNHVALSDDVVAEAEKKFQAQQRQLENLNKRLEKGKISEKNYLHQARSILM